MGTRLPSGRLGVPLCRNLGTRRPRQQEVSYRPPSHHPRRQERRGTQPTLGRRHHRFWRCPSQHPCHPLAKEKREERRLNDRSTKRRKTKPEIFISTFSNRN